MRIQLALVAMVVGAAGPASVVAARVGGELQGPVQIYIVDQARTFGTLEPQSTGIAAKVFASVGVRVSFHEGEPPAHADRPILITVKTGEQAGSGPLAYAYPYEGTRIEIIGSRVRRDSRTATMFVYSYVLVHEITHVLQGMDRHGVTGIMKARWNAQDELDMRKAKLTFTDDDVESLEMGMRFRYTGTR